MSELGQFFTIDRGLQDAVCSFILNQPKEILEPSVGRGDLVVAVNKKMSGISWDLYEIDPSLSRHPEVSDTVTICDFVEFCVDKKYFTIVGNPPYFKKGGSNIYVIFIEKCFRLLKSEGELVFIIPSDFFKLTSTKGLIEEMLKCGKFTHIYKPDNEHLFKNATVDVIVFRYQKTENLSSEVLINGEVRYFRNTRGSVTFSETPKEEVEKIVSDYFDVFVGIVSGKEDVFKNETFGNVSVLNGKDVVNKYILLEEFPSKNNELNKYLENNKQILLDRKIRKITVQNWYQWGALRNMKTIGQNKGKKCIYIYNLTRQKQVAFVGEVMLFGGNLLCMIPKEKSQEMDLEKVVNFLNGETFKNTYTYSGRFKIGQRELTNALLSFV